METSLPPTTPTAQDQIDQFVQTLHQTVAACERFSGEQLAACDELDGVLFITIWKKDIPSGIAAGCFVRAQSAAGELAAQFKLCQELNAVGAKTATLMRNQLDGVLQQMRDLRAEAIAGRTGQPPVGGSADQPGSDPVERVPDR